MNEQILSAIVSEIAPLVANRPLGRIFQLTGASIAIDFRLSKSDYLFISVEPAKPRFYMINRSVREMEKSALPPSSFLQSVRKHFSGAQLRALWKETGERIVHLDFDGFDQAGARRELSLLAQLTGRSAELYALDENRNVLAALRINRELDSSTGSVYQPPPPAQGVAHLPPAFDRGQFKTLSEAADHYYRRLEAEQSFRARVAAEISRLRRDLEKRRKLQQALRRDLIAHGDAAEHKRLGDLLLANIAGARRAGKRVVIVDYFAEGAPEVEIEIDENHTLQEEAVRRYQKYGKSKRAAEEINRRLKEIDQEIARIEREQARAEKQLAERDYELWPAGGEQVQNAQSEPSKQARKKSEDEALRGLKRYRSSDGYEVLVGRGARDNDRLTFRVARSHDLWLHAADYPGAHVVIVNHDRHRDVPQRTIIEAAQIAAHHSQARADTKVNVHYTERKHLAKPRGAAPGLVRMSRFRTMLVEPRETIPRI